MNDAPDDLSLAANFPAATFEQWRELAEGVLKGARVEDRLRGTTADGLSIEPLYARAANAGQVQRPKGARWQVLQRVDHPDPAVANAEVLDDLANGADGLVLVRAGLVGANGYGLPREPSSLVRVLEGVQLNAGVALELDLRYAAALADIGKQQGIAPGDFNARFCFDPLGVAALTGGFAQPWSDAGRLAARIVADGMTQGFRGPFIVADGRIVHDAGGTEAQELAYVLAAAVAYLRALEAHGLSLDHARRMIFFRLGADADEILAVTKFRSLRKLWRRVEESCGLTPEPTFVAAETAWRMMTRNDPHVNILRATIAVFAAALGGADAITVLPFTTARGLAAPFARRLARNTQLVLRDEGHIAKVADPAAGTGWAEQLGDALCRAAWSLFQEIEAAGGAARALERGLIQEQVARARAEREQALRAGRDALVGVTIFTPPDDLEIEVLDVPPPPVPALDIAVPVRALAPMRLAAQFETIRKD
jgi:methylmalonyl-CoA mutase